MRRSETVVLTSAAVVVAGLLSACDVKPPANALTIATAPKSSGVGSNGALLSGQLGGVVESRGEACLWVTAANGVRTPVQWPHGWWAEDGPLRLFDSKGHMKAAVGMKVDLGGGTLADGKGAWGCPPSTPAFSASTAEQNP